MTRYLRILRRAAARNPFLASVIGRLPISMAPLATVLLVQQVYGSYGVAGLVTGMYALGATAGTPVLGRLVDRVGQPRVIAPAGLLSALLLTALALVAAAGAPVAALLAIAAGAGLTAPPLASVTRGTWRVALRGEDDRLAAYALDAVAVEFIFVVGPLLVGVLLVTTPPAAPLLVTAGLLVVGSLAYARSGAVRAWRPEPHPHPNGRPAPSPVSVAGVRRALAVALLLALSFAHLDLSIAATAREALGDPGRVGLLFACIAGGSGVGGLWYGSRTWRWPERLRLPVALAGVTTGLAAVAILLGGVEGVVRRPPALILGALLLIAGVCIAPALIAINNLVDAVSPRSRLSEAQAWVSTAYTAGGAGGTALAGLLVDGGGPGRGFVGAFALMLAGLLAAAASQPFWRSADPVPARPELAASVP
ncbi:MAG TPA: MFS transporter [Kineosporiaceae bacterium]|nr:MFS transporter [Kineosporiaceae bacterium]